MMKPNTYPEPVASSGDQPGTMAPQSHSDRSTTLNDGSCERAKNRHDGDCGEPTADRSTIPHDGLTLEQIEASKPIPSSNLTDMQMAMLSVTNPNEPHRVYENQCSAAIKNMARKLYFGYWENSPLPTESWESLTPDVRANWCAAALVAFPNLSQ